MTMLGDLDWDTLLPAIGGVLGAVLLLGLLYLQTQASRECSQAGGVLVRADIGYACVSPHPKGVSSR